MHIEDIILIYVFMFRREWMWCWYKNTNFRLLDWSVAMLNFSITAHGGNFQWARSFSFLMRYKIILLSSLQYFFFEVLPQNSWHCTRSNTDWLLNLNLIEFAHILEFYIFYIRMIVVGLKIALHFRNVHWE